MNASSKTLMRIPQIEWSGELLSVSFRLFRVSSHLPCLFELAKCIFFEQLVWKEKKEKQKAHKLDCQDSSSRFSASC